MVIVAGPQDVKKCQKCINGGVFKREGGRGGGGGGEILSGGGAPCMYMTAVHSVHVHAYAHAHAHAHACTAFLQ